MDNAKSDSTKAPSTSRKVMHGVAGQRIKKTVPLGTPLPPETPTTSGSGAGTYPNMLYQGGPVIQNPNVFPVFVGDWSSSANQTRASRLAQFITDLLNSSYMNVLSQYGVGSSGTVAPSVFLPNSVASLGHNDIINLLQNAIKSTTPATHLPEPAGSDCYILYLDDNTGVDDTVTGIVMCEASSDTAFGYHSVFTTTAGNPFYFAVIPGLTDTCLTNSCPLGNSTCNLQTTMPREQRQTGVSSHELSEMFTNPANTGTATGSNFAWIDETDLNINTGFPADEIGDVCAGNYGSITVGSNTWTVQNIYSKTDDQNTNGATTCVTSEPYPLPSLLPAVSLILDRSTFGKDEVGSALAHASTDTFEQAFFVVIDGYTPDELGLTSANLGNPPNLPTFQGSFAALGDPAIAFDPAYPVQLDSSSFYVIQRITFPFKIVFSSLNTFSNLSLNNPSATYSLSAQIVNANDSAGYPVVTSPQSAVAEFELVFQADPFMDHGETWWLSNDMRVFQYTPAMATSTIPLQYSSTAWTGNPNTYIHNLLAELNKSFIDPSLINTPFNGIASDELASYLNLTGTDGHGNPVYNFGVARVHLQGDTAANVRTFFRLFISSSPDTDFSKTTTFRSTEETDPTTGNPISGTLIPLLGFPDSDMSSTIPFFAAPRVDSTSLPLTAQTDPDNVQTIPNPTAPAPLPGAEVYAYFGCWLDLNQGTPQFPVNPSTQAKPDGPYPAADILSIPALIMSNHACLVAEIAYKPDPIPAGANASTSDKIGQRNLSWTPSGNPGPIAGHFVPSLFDLKLTSPAIPQDQLPDELMIEWGQVPAGSLASIYWPQVGADDVLALANLHYSFHKLTAKDAHTIQVATGSLTYIPIPVGTGPNLAGLLTIELPAGVRTGQQFDVVVRRLRTRNIKGDTRANVGSASPEFANPDTINWRYVVGAFQIRIPVSADPILLEPEESLLALFKWKIEQIPATNRWNPVLTRYIQQVSGRVNAYGGNPGSIPPSQNGYPGITRAGHHHLQRHENTGKVSGVVYDRFGDFEGFTLLTEHGVEHLYLSREEEIERLIRLGWEDRIVISVFASHHHPDHPSAIVLRRIERPI